MFEVYYSSTLELFTIFILVLSLMITKNYVKYNFFEYLFYMFIFYFFAVAIDLFYFFHGHNIFLIFIQYNLYIGAFYFVYKIFVDRILKNARSFWIIIGLVVFSVLPILINYSFGQMYVYYVGNAIFGISLIITGALITLYNYFSVNERIFGMLLVAFAAFRLQLSAFPVVESYLFYYYILLMVIEVTISLFVVAIGHEYISSENVRKNKIYQNLYDNSNDAILILNYETIQNCNNKALKFFDVEAEKIIGKSVLSLSKEEQYDGRQSTEFFYRQIDRSEEEPLQPFSWTFFNSKFEEINSEMSLFPIGRNTYASIIRDMSHLYNDELTGFPKRDFLINRVEQTLQENKDQVALIALNIDNFKDINDEFGYKFGDSVIVLLSKRLKKEFKNHTIARIGGDEFIILFDNIYFLSQLYIYLEKIKAVLSETFIINGIELLLSACIGVVYNNDGTMGANEIINNVDFTLNFAKKVGKGTIEFFSKEHKAEFSSRITAERDMIAGLERGEFIPYYQPIVDAATEAIIGAEALVRWVKEDGSVVFPNSFIPLAEENGKIIDIDYIVLREACKHCKEMIKYYPDFVIHINISAKHLGDFKIVEEVQRNLEQCELTGKHLVMEVTETTFIENIDNVSVITKRIRDLGVQVALDDFGTGHSSLAYLSRMNIDVVKIDRSFIVKVPNDLKAKAIVEFIVLLNKLFKFSVVVEGVEEQEQVDYLKWLMVDYMQGYFYYRPMPFEDFKILIEESYSL